MDKYDFIDNEDEATPTRDLAPKNVYDQVFEEEDIDNSAQLKQSMFVAADRDPDRHAEVLKLSEQQNLPARFVEQNFDELQKKVITTKNYAEEFKSTPALAKFMQEPDNAAVARDDIQSLKKVEDVVQDHGFMESVRNWVGTGMAQLNADVSKLPALAYDTAAWPQNKLNQLIGRNVRVTSDQTFLGQNNAVTQKYEADAKTFRDQAPELSQSMVAEIKTGNYSGAGKALLAQTIANSPQQVLLLASALSGFGVAGLAGAGATSAAAKNAENLKAGIDPTIGLPNALATGAFEAGFESLGTLGFLKTWEKALSKQYGKQISKEVVGAYMKTLTQSILGEATEEGLTSVAQDSTDYITGVNPDAMTGMGERAINAGLIGAASGGGMTAPAAALNHQAGAHRAQQVKNFYLSMEENLEATKLRKRLPESQRKYVEQLVQGGPVENIYIPVERMDAYFQSAKVSPTAAMQEIGVLEAYNEAKETGGDIKVPLATWAHKVAGTAHYQGLADDIRFSPEGQSVNEIKILKQEEAQAIEAEALKASEAEPVQAEPSEREGVKSRIIEQLTQVIQQSGFTGQQMNISQKQIEAFAEMQSGRNEVRANLRGENQREFFENNPLPFQEMSPDAPSDSQSFEQGSEDRPFQTEIPYPDQVPVVHVEDAVGDMAQVRDGAKAQFTGKSFVNSHTGWTIEVKRRGLGKASSTLASDGNRLALANLDKLIASAVYSRTEEDSTGHDNKLRIFYAPMSTPTKEYVVKIVARESNGKLFYDKFAIEKETPTAGAHQTEIGTEAAGEARPQSVNIDDFKRDVKTVQKGDAFFQGAVREGTQKTSAESIKQAIEEATGKELNLEFSDDGYHREVISGSEDVPTIKGERLKRAKRAGFDVSHQWFHGSRANIESFSGDTLGASTGAGSARMAHFFASSPVTASEYAEASDDALTLRSARTEAEATRASDAFKARMKEKYGAKWTSKLSTEERAERASIAKQFKQSMEDYAASQESAAHKIEWLKYKIEQRKVSLQSMEKDLKTGAVAEENAKTAKYLEARKALLENKDWVLSSDGRNYNVVDRSTGEKIVNPHLSDKDDDRKYVFYESPTSVQSVVDRLTARIAENTEKNLKASIKDSKAELSEMKARLSKNLEGTEGQVVYPTVLKMVRPLIVDFQGADYREVTYREILERAQEAGYDGVIFKNTQDPAFSGYRGEDPETIDVAAVFQPQQVRSVNAQFKDLDSALILAQAGQNAESARGRFRIDAVKRLIELGPKADVSTLLHESMHAFVFEMRDDFNYFRSLDPATLTPAQTQFLKDAKTLLDFVEADSVESMTVAQHEKLAEAAETFFMTGKAPTSALQEVFAKFRVWLINIYKSLSPYGITLSPEIEDVFARMIATEAEIAQAQAEQNITPLFGENPETFGLTGAKAERYRKATTAAKDYAYNTLLNKFMEHFRKQREVFYKEQRQANRDRIAVEVGLMPIYRALDILKTDQIKLSKEALNAYFDKDMVKALPRGISIKEKDGKGGLHPDIAAEMLGFENGAKLLAELGRAEKKDDLIERLTDNHMNKFYPDLINNPDAVKKQAQDAVHNEPRSKLLRLELEYLASEELPTLKDVVRKGVRRVPPEGEVRKQAQTLIGQKRLTEIRPSVFMRAERNAAKEAGDALTRGDLQKAFEAKRRELLNHELYRAALGANEIKEKALENFKKLKRKDEDLAKTRDMDLVNAARAILARIGLGSAEKPPMFYLEKIQKYDPDMYQGIASQVLAATESNATFEQMTFDQFYDMNEAVKNLWDLSKSTRQFEIDGQKMDRNMVRQELIDALNEQSGAGDRPGYKQAATFWEKTRADLLGLKSMVRRVEHWATAMDRGDRGGPFTKYFINPIFEATARYRIEKNVTLEKFREIVKPIANTLDGKKIEATQLGYTFQNKAELLGALLHMGNNSNLTKLLVGRNWGAVDEAGELNRSRFDAFLGQMFREQILTKPDMDFLQSTWDLLETLKAPAQKAHKRMYGFYFNEITANEFQTPFGTYRGGYVPAMADQLLVEDAALRNDQNQLEALQNAMMFPTTGRGFTKSRVDGYTVPLVMNLNMVQSHIDKVLRFIHIEPTVKDVSHIVMDKDFRTQLSAFDPSVGSDMLVPWLKRTAQQAINTPSQGRGGKAFDRLASTLRKRAGLQLMVLNVINSVQNLTGISPASVRVPPRILMRAQFNYVRKPGLMAEHVTEKSDFMKTRIGKQSFDIQSEINDMILNPNAYDKAKEFVTKHGYIFQVATQNVMEIVTWTGAYDYAVEQGLSERESVRSADATVRETQMGMNPEDLSRMEAGSGFERLFTMFAGYFNTQVNLLTTEFSIARELGLKQGASRAFYAYVCIVAAPAILGSLIARTMGGAFDEDDDGEYLDDAWDVMFGSQMRFLTAMIPGGSVATGLLNAVNDKPFDDKITVSPVISMIERSFKTIKTVPRALSGDGKPSAAIKDALTLVGMLSGFPAAPLARPVGYLTDVMTDNVEPSGPIDMARGVLTGKSPKQN